MIIDLPFFKTLIKAHTYLLDSTSNPEVGSSNIINLEPPTNAIAKDSFLFMPPESYLASLSLCSVNMTKSSVSFIERAITSFLISLSSHTKSRCSYTVKSSNNTSNY
jgi:hypothetical protein